MLFYALGQGWATAGFLPGNAMKKDQQGKMPKVHGGKTPLRAICKENNCVTRRMKETRQ
jgi:hypothetical protein